MSLLLSVKPAYVVGGLGVAAAPAIGYGGWKIYEGMDSPVGREFSGKGYKFNPPILDLTLRPIEEDNRFKIRTYRCFQNFFPGAKIGDAHTSNTTTGGDVPNFVNGNVGVGAGNPMGCALMQLDYKTNTDFIFTSEIVVKNDEVGLALWTTVTSAETKQNGHHFDPKSWAYYLFIFKKDKTAQTWKTIGGVWWPDSELKNNGSGALKDVHISSPEGAWLDRGSPVSPETGPFKKNYSGFWESGTTGKEIFQNIKVYKDLGNANILGKERKPEGGENLFSNDSVLSVAHYQNDGWIEHPTNSGPLAYGVLNSMYAPFNGRKGTWTNFKGQEDCTRWRRNRNIGDAEKTRLQNLCYIDSAV